MAETKTEREKIEGRLAGMKGERSEYEKDWEEIARLTMSHRVDINPSSSTKAKRRANTVTHDSAGRKAGRTLVNGMSTGLTSSSRPWFKLTIRDRDMMEYAPVRDWLYAVEQAIYGLFSMTNYYDISKIIYADLGHMGVGATMAVEHSEYLAVWHHLPVGSYWLGIDSGLRVDTLARQAAPTVKQLVDEVRDWNKLTPQVKQFYDKSDYSVRVPIMQLIEPNTDPRGQKRSGSVTKPWRSVKWEVGQNNKNILLSEKGFDSKPFTAPRWETRGEQVYCDTSPAFDALPDLRELQLAARRASRAMDILVKPPMRAPAAMQRTGLSFDPGTVSYMDAMADSSSVGPLFQTNYQSVGAIQQKVDWLTNRVNELFYADLFMAISDMEGVQPRNEQELMYRNEEKLTQLGPVVDRVNIEKLELDIDRAFTICKNLNLIPPPPDELNGQPLLIDFISILAQAQRAAANTAIERAARFVGFLGEAFPDALIKFDAEQAVDEFAQNSGTSPKIIRSDEIVQQMKDAAAQQQQSQQMANMAAPMKDAASAAELLSRTQVDDQGTSALQRMLGQ